MNSAATTEVEVPNIPNAEHDEAFRATTWATRTIRTDDRYEGPDEWVSDNYEADRACSRYERQFG